MPVSGLPDFFAHPSARCRKCSPGRRSYYGARRLVTVGGRSLTFVETEAAAAGYAAALAAAGVKAGDRVAIMCGNRLELLLTILGCGWLGAIAVPINTASRGAQLEHILANCGARLLVVERELVPVVARLDRGRIALETLWLVGDGEGGAKRAALHFRDAVSAAGRAAFRRIRSSPAIPSRSSIRPARPACRKACAVRTRNIFGGRSIPAGFSASAKAMC